MKTNAKATAKLSREARSLYQKVTDEYEIRDAGGLSILSVACEAFDRMRECQKLIKRDGVSFRDRFGGIKANPLLASERDARAQFLSALKQLNLDLEPLRDIGRPAGR